MAKGISVDQSTQNGKINRAQVDVTQPEGELVVEIDYNRRVLYIHMEGYSVLRVCRFQDFRLVRHGHAEPKSVASKVEVV